MNKILSMKKVYVLILMAAFFTTVSLSAAPRTLQNKIIKVSVDLVGHFKVYTTGGDPDSDNDNNKDLLNNKEFGSSFFLVNVDGKIAKYGSSAGKNIVYTRVVNGTIESEWKFNGVVFTQNISLFEGLYTAKKNLVRISIIVNNTSKSSKKVGIKAVLDTNMGPLDSIGINAPGTGAKEKGFFIKKDKKIPSVFYVCEKPLKSGANLELNLHGPKLVRPDAIYIAREAYLKKDNVFTVTVNEDFQDSFTGKSALAMIWNPKKFMPGEKDSIAFAAGVAIYEKREGSPLNVSVASPLTMGNQSAWIGIVIENENKFWDVKDVNVKLSVNGQVVKLISSKNKFVFNRLERTKKVFASWKITPLKSELANVSIIVEYTYRSSRRRSVIQKKINVKLP